MLMVMRVVMLYEDGDADVEDDAGVEDDARVGRLAIRRQGIKCGDVVHSDADVRGKRSEEVWPVKVRIRDKQNQPDSQTCNILKSRKTEVSLTVCCKN